MNKKFTKSSSIAECLILVVGIIAFAWIIGIWNVGEVSGAGSSSIPIGTRVFDDVTKQEVVKVDEYVGATEGDDGAIFSMWRTEKGEFFRTTTPDSELAVNNPSWNLPLKSIAMSLVYAGMAAGIVGLIASFTGMESGQSIALTAATFGGVFAGESTFKIMAGSEKFALSGNTGNVGASWAGIGVGVAVAALILYFMYSKETSETVRFECRVWEPPLGGKYCEECNKQNLPCSEYQCRSLGQSCQLLNKGTSQEKCAWVNRNDVNPPVMTPLIEVLSEGFKYTPDSTISPPDRGVFVVNEESTTGCVKAFFPLTFGITTDEPAQCKIDYKSKRTFDEMDFYLGGTQLFDYNHTQIMALPGPNSLNADNITLYNNGKFEMYVRCKDSNGNQDTGNFVFKFCVEKGPDTTPPLIVTTDFLNNAPIAANQTSLGLKVYVNEPAECRWSHDDEPYDDMTEQMKCSSNVLEMNAQMLYECNTNLTGLKNRMENKFYFRCKDQPKEEDSKRNANLESYVFNVIGTQPLVITSVGPNGTIKDATESVKVTLTTETSAGYNEGVSSCYYSDTGEDDSYIMFYNTASYSHSQDLYLKEGSYNYFIKCVDLGGNSDTDRVSFVVDTDTNPPMVVRVYHEESYLKLITDEEASCVYSDDSCTFNFADGIKMTTTNEVEQFTDWNLNKIFYIKCKDIYDNQPNPDKCSITARPFEVSNND